MLLDLTHCVSSGMVAKPYQTQKLVMSLLFDTVISGNWYGWSKGCRSWRAFYIPPYYQNLGGMHASNWNNTSYGSYSL